MTTNKVSAQASARPDHGKRISLSNGLHGISPADAESLALDVRYLANVAYLAAQGIRHISEDREISVEDAMSLVDLTRNLSVKAFNLYALLFDEEA